MDKAVYAFGLIHLILYAGLGLSFVIYCCFRVIPGISRTIWQHRDDVLPKWEP